MATMIAPGPYQSFQTRGARYTSDANSVVASVAQADIDDMLAMGCKHTMPSLQTAAANGLTATPMALTGFKNADGSVLAAAASAGKFGYSVSLGTSFALTGEAANNNTKTDDAIAEYVLPSWYVAGTDLTVTVNAELTGAGTPGTKTAQIFAYRTAADGAQGDDIGPAVASAITAAGADIAFAIDGATLNPGDRVILKLEVVLQETAVSDLTALVNSVRVS
jgi:hypothetical protein